MNLFDMLMAKKMLGGGSGGGSGIEEGTATVTVLSERTLDGFALNSTFGVYAISYRYPLLTLVEGTTYKVVWDGEEFVREAFAFAFADGSKCVGLGNKLATGTDSGEPFIIVYDATSRTTHILSTDTATSHTVAVYREFSKNVVTVFEEQAVGPFSSGSFEVSPSPLKLIVGETYRVVWDGVEHDCVCKEQDGGAVVTDLVMDEGEMPTSGTFFAGYSESVAAVDGKSLLEVVAFDLDSGGMDAATYHTAGIYQVVSGGSESANIQPLEITENGTYTAEGDVAGFSPVVVNVASSGGGAGIDEGWVCAQGTFTAEGTTAEIEHGLGVIPAYVVCGLHGNSNTFPSDYTLAFAMEKSAEQKSLEETDVGGWLFAYNPSGSNPLMVASNNYSLESANGYTPIGKATELKITFGSDTWPANLGDGNTYQWFAAGRIGGVVEDGIVYTRNEAGEIVGATVFGELAPSAFEGNTTLEWVSLSNSELTSVPNSAFRKCTALKAVTLPSGLKSIGDGAFSGCSSLSSITIPSGVTSIGNSAFYNCTALKSITIPASTKSILPYAFSGSGLTSATFEDSSGWYITQTEGATSGTNLTISATTYRTLTGTFASSYWYNAT